MKQKPPSEKEVASHIISYLRNNGYEIYQEVPIGGGAIDIVATQDSLIVAIETKTNLGLDVLEQASSWLGHANMVYCGVPKPKRSQSTFGRRVASKFGIGTIEVFFPKEVSEYNQITVSENIEPVFYRKTSDRIKNALRPEMMSGEYGVAGTRTGGRFTPFKETTETLLKVVRSNPGIELKRAIEAIKRHHYVSNAAARVNLKKYIENGVIKGLTYSTEGGKFVLNATGN